LRLRAYFDVDPATDPEYGVTIPCGLRFAIIVADTPSRCGVRCAVGESTSPSSMITASWFRVALEKTAGEERETCDATARGCTRLDAPARGCGRPGFCSIVHPAPAPPGHAHSRAISHRKRCSGLPKDPTYLSLGISTA
jgi:hypothetical protein